MAEPHPGVSLIIHTYLQLELQILCTYCTWLSCTYEFLECHRLSLVKPWITLVAGGEQLYQPVVTQVKK